MDFQSARYVVSRITYKPNWMIYLHEQSPTVWLLWCILETRDSVRGDLTSLESRTWYVDDTFTEDDLIETAFLAIQEMENHEMREFFKVDGYPVYNPHIPIYARIQAIRESFNDDTLASLGVK